MNKIYQRIDWENYPSSATPLNEDNLNKMDYAIDKLDDRVVAHETTKLDTATGNILVKDVTFDEATGIFTIEKLSGSKITINTALEKISTNFHFNPTTQKLVLTLIDGTVQEIDLSALITQYEFIESDTITFEIDASGKVKSNILNGSITGEKLEPNYLSDVTLQANNAKTSADNAKTSEELAYQYAEEAKESASQTAKSDAKNITYDNAESGLSATNVKDALDEVAQGSDSALKDGDGNVITETYVKKQGDATIKGDVIATKTNGATVSLINNSVPDTCKTITDWNNAVTNGWYMANGASNQPSNIMPWWIGRVTAHNSKFLVQEAWGFTGSALPTLSVPKRIRVKMNDVWGNWEDDTPSSYAKKDDVNSALNGKVDKSSVLSTVSECEASTTNTDVASASALSELKDSMYDLQTSRINTEMFYGYLVTEDGTGKLPLYCQNVVVDGTFPNNQDVVIKTFNKVANFTVKDVRFFQGNGGICWFAGGYITPSVIVEGDNALLRIRQTVTGAEVEAKCHVFVVYSKLN